MAIACAIRLACSSVGEDFGWVRLIEVPSWTNHIMLAESLHLSLVKFGEIHCTKTDLPPVNDRSRCRCETMVRQ